MQKTRSYDWLTIAALAVILALIVQVVALAAPGQKHDEITGDILFPDDKSPVVNVPTRTPEGEWQPQTYWLVFTNQDTENQALKFERGTTVKANGRLAGGGKYKYLIVTSIETAK